MKKVLSLVALSATFLLSGCNVGDLFIDEVAVHNGLVQKMDAVLDAEEDFYEVYIALFDGDDTAELEENYAAFEAAFADLDTYFTETKFASSQQNFITKYEEDYKPYVEDYTSYAGEFVDAVVTEGVTFEVMEPFFEELDEYAVEYVDVHNAMIDEVNLQADEPATASGY